MIHRLLQVTLFAICASMLSVLLMIPIDLTTQDLGRHIENGKLVWEQGLVSNSVLTKNTYSYTYTDFQSINHHWLSGVVFYLLVHFGSFAVAQWFYIFTLLTALAVVWFVSQKKYGLWPTLIAVILLLPLMAFRREVRPEAISILFFWLLILLWEQVIRGVLHKYWLWLTPLILLIWINSHIYFFLGFGVVVAYLVQLLVQKKTWYEIRLVVWILLSSLVVVLLNPGGVLGVLYPLRILQEYGYLVAENQTIWFLWRLGMQNIEYTWFAWMAGVSGGLLVLSLIWRKRFSVAWWILTLGVIGMGLLAIRNIAFFGFAAVILLAWVLKEVALFMRNKIPGFWRMFAPALVVVALTISLGLGILLRTSWLSLLVSQRAVGLADKNDASLPFLQKYIQGPIFNNYDIGSYLAYVYFPDEKVFVDNRPESYPVDFFKNVYVPMQESEVVWQEQLLKWQFNAIIFAWHDLTPWAQQFLKKRVKDPLWVPVYIDPYVLVLVKDVPQNSEVIKQFAYPREMFR